jgi:hypothetical protein
MAPGDRSGGGALVVRGSRNGFLDAGRGGMGSSKGDVGVSGLLRVPEMPEMPPVTGDVERLRKGLFDARFSVKPVAGGCCPVSRNRSASDGSVHADDDVDG